jgi:hypothetical protein
MFAGCRDRQAGQPQAYPRASGCRQSPRDRASRQFVLHHLHATRAATLTFSVAVTLPDGTIRTADTTTAFYIARAL